MVSSDCHRILHSPNAILLVSDFAHDNFYQVYFRFHNFFSLIIVREGSARPGDIVLTTELL